MLYIHALVIQWGLEFKLDEDKFIMKSVRFAVSLLLRTHSFHNGAGSRLASALIAKPKEHQITCCSIQKKHFHLSTSYNGLEEFFEKPDDIGRREIKSAAPWSRDLLRLKSNEDLHKLWFILLKERNMLETMQYHYETIDEPMQSPQRLEKVAESMSNLRDILEEREKAQNMLLLGRATKAPGEFRKSGVGAIYWYQYKKHLIPKHLAKDLYGDRPADIARFNYLLQEWHVRYQERKVKVQEKYQSALKFKWSKIRVNNPNLPKKPPQWWLKKFSTKLRYGIHPEQPLIYQPNKTRKS